MSECNTCIFNCSSIDEILGVGPVWSHTCNLASYLHLEEYIIEVGQKSSITTPTWCPLKTMKQINIIWK
jgi:hypothetical protein